MRNTPCCVTAVMHRLAAADIPCLLFGGWAEEALGLAQPRPHKDIDLLLQAPSFDAADRLLSRSNIFDEVALKRFAHKRAFMFDAVLIEITLIQTEGGIPVTWFWGDVRFAWRTPLSEACDLGGHRLPTASGENLRHHRINHRQTEPWRWRDQASLIVRA
jgi:hypothetical protein